MKGRITMKTRQTRKAGEEKTFTIRGKSQAEINAKMCTYLEKFVFEITDIDFVNRGIDGFVVTIHYFKCNN